MDQETSSLHYEVSSLAMEREQALKVRAYVCGFDVRASVHLAVRISLCVRESDVPTAHRLFFFTQSSRALEKEVDQLKGKLVDNIQERTALIEKVEGLRKEVR